MGGNLEFIGSIQRVQGTLLDLEGGNGYSAVLQTTSYSYDTVTGDLLSITKTPGPGTTSSATTSFTYEPPSPTTFDRLLTIVEPLGQTIHFSYADSIPEETVTDPLGRITTITLSPGTGEVTAVTDALNNPPTTYTYDSFGNPASVTLPSATNPQGNKTSYQMDASGAITQVVTPLRETSSYINNGVGEIKTATDADANVTSLKYDLLGVPKQVTDANNNVTTITRTATLDITTTCDPAGNCTTDNRDAMGRKSTFTDKRGVQTTYTHDKFGRITKAVANSNNKGSFDQRTTNYTYDALDRVTSITDQDANLPATTINYLSYDGYDNVLQEQNPDGSVSTYNYDANNRRISTQIGTQPQVSYTYYDDDQIRTISTPTVTATLTYDGDGRRQSLTTTGVAPNGVTTNYIYDIASQLIQETYTANGVSLGDLEYTYDPDGRIISKGGSLARTNLPVALTSATYSNTNQLKTWNSGSAAFNSANDLTTDPSNSGSYTWDSRLQLSNSSTISGFLNPIYDALGRRSSASSGSGTTTYLHDRSTVVSSTNGGTSNSVLTIPGSGEVLAYSTTWNQLTSSWVPIHDALGSTVALVDSTGAMATQYTYDPYGNTTVTGQANPFPFLYAGMEQDSTGLYHAMARYYNPLLQRFLSEDPAGFDGGDINLLNYAGNDPINRSDPSGTCIEDGCIDLTVLAIVAVAGGSFSLDALLDPFGLFSGGQPSIPRQERHLPNTGEGKDNAGLRGAFVRVQYYEDEEDDADETPADSGLDYTIPYRGGPPVKTEVVTGEARAPKSARPNSIYEQTDPFGFLRSRSFYDDYGHPFCRQDFEPGHGVNGPHEHTLGFYPNGMQMIPESVAPLKEGYDPNPPCKGQS